MHSFPCSIEGSVTLSPHGCVAPPQQVLGKAGRSTLWPQTACAACGQNVKGRPGGRPSLIAGRKPAVEPWFGIRRHVERSGPRTQGGGVRPLSRSDDLRTRGATFGEEATGRPALNAAVFNPAPARTVGGRALGRRSAFPLVV